eukprot:2333293-Amphidinium_carterae.1
MERAWVKVSGGRKVLNYRRDLYANVQDLLRQVKQDMSKRLADIDLDALELYNQEAEPRQAHCFGKSRAEQKSQ